MKIIGLDPGLRNCGYGIIHAHQNKFQFIAAGTISPSDKLPMEQRLLAIFNALGEVFTTHQPQLCVIEEVFVSLNPQSTLKLGQARAMCLLVPAIHQVPINEHATRAVKQAITGSGKADKIHIQTMLRILIPSAEYKTEHESDALACAIAGFHLKS